jgi:hypothetical protein
VNDGFLAIDAKSTPALDFTFTLGLNYDLAVFEMNNPTMPGSAAAEKERSEAEDSDE